MESNLWKEFKTDKNLEQEGQWFAAMPGVRFLVRRYGGSNMARVNEANARFQKPLIRKIQAGSASEAEIYEVTLKTLVSACMVDWQGITDKDGNEIPFSFENAVKVLAPVEDLTNALLKYASNFENFKQYSEDEVGNS